MTDARTPHPEPDDRSTTMSTEPRDPDASDQEHDRSPSLDPPAGGTGTSVDDPPAATSASAPLRRRRFRPASTVFGLLFLGVAAAWAAREQELLDGDELGRAVAVALIVLGGLGLVVSVLLSRRSRPGSARTR
jgi:hypothetical protein